MPNPETGSPSLTGERRQQLAEVRQGLLDVHKALLEEERILHERAHGRVSSGTELLQLVLHDPWFAWLRPLSALIVQIDEATSSREPVADSVGAALVSQARDLLRADEHGNVFHRRYHVALQESPAVVLAHAAVRRSLIR